MIHQQQQKVSVFNSNNLENPSNHVTNNYIINNTPSSTTIAFVQKSNILSETKNNIETQEAINKKERKEKILKKLPWKIFIVNEIS